MTTLHPTLCAVVVTHNRLGKLRLALDRLLAEPVDRIVIVDNASDDGTHDYLRNIADPRLDVVRLPVNSGGAGGFEAGMRHAVQQHDSDWLLVQDDDAWPEPGLVDAFRASLPTEFDAIATAVRAPDGTICEMNRPLFNPFRSLPVFLRTALGGGRGAFHLKDSAFVTDAPREVDGGSFVGLFLSRRAIQLAGYPDARLFVYSEDTLFCMALRKAGGRVGFLPGLRYTHDSASLAGPGMLRPDWKLYFYHRNLLILYRAAAGFLFWPALLVILPKWFLRLVTSPGNRAIRARLLLWALRDGLRQDLSLSLADIQSRLAQHRS